MNLMPQDITQVKNFLYEQEKKMKPSVHNKLTCEIIELVFQILQKEFELELVKVDQEMAVR